METSKHLNDIAEIKNLMERSKRFISLSGLSGVFIGLIAIIGVVFALFYLNIDLTYLTAKNYYFDPSSIQFSGKSIYVLYMDALLVLFLALLSAFYFSYKKATKNGYKFWDQSAKRLLVSLFIPLTTGGILCLILLNYQLFYLLAPITLIFYGLALVNASSFTLNEIKYLGISEILLGLVAAILLDYHLLIWALGFGILHVLYGGYMYYKYDRKAN
jgi:hypothetical protein